MKILVSSVVLLVSISSCFSLKKELCGLPHSLVGGPNFFCEANILMWSYNAAATECVQFGYGGCDGNANRFSTKDLCEETCLE